MNNIPYEELREASEIERQREEGFAPFNSEKELRDELYALEEYAVNRGNFEVW